jgi:hypothetical protein
MKTATYDHDRNLLELTVDNGDGTGTRTDYTTDPPTVTELTGLPIPEPAPTAEERIAELEAVIAALLEEPA